MKRIAVKVAIITVGVGTAVAKSAISDLRRRDREITRWKIHSALLARWQLLCAGARELARRTARLLASQFKKGRES